jgi:hypothetical protein
MKIGIWINISHFPAGGPTVVCLGVLIGLKQLIPDCILVINEPGELNFQLFGADRDIRLYPTNTVFGPNPIAVQHIDFINPDDDEKWKYAKTMTFSAVWIINWLEQKFPIRASMQEDKKRVYLWESGVDTVYYTPSDKPKTQDFFIYYKSQRPEEVEQVWGYLFSSYYEIKGDLLCYHFYKPEMLRDVAQRSKFCIMIDNEETQGLAALEIMACNCPIFCIDKPYYQYKSHVMRNSVTSIVSWNDCCGMKSDWEKWKTDFPTFLNSLANYTPAQFVQQKYSYKECAKTLVSIAVDSIKRDISSQILASEPS